MQQLLSVLPEYEALALQTLSSNHLIAPIQVEHLPLLFMVDTGASHTCIATETASLLRLPTSGNADLLTSATGTQTGNIDLVFADSITLGNITLHRQSFMAIDFSHINQRLASMTGITVQGILGADMLLALKAIIDVANAVMYLKK